MKRRQVALTSPKRKRICGVPMTARTRHPRKTHTKRRARAKERRAMGLEGGRRPLKEGGSLVAADNGMV